MQNVKALRKFGRGRCFGWNTESVWGEILGENGFVKICLSRGFYSGVLATKLAMGAADYAITEAGFGADLGAEKFLDITWNGCGS